MEHHELSCLLAKLRKSIEIWFHIHRDEERSEPTNSKLEINVHDVSFHHIQLSIMAIVQHGLRSIGELQLKQRPTYVSLNRSLHDLVFPKYALQKFVDDFEWVRGSAQVRDALYCRDKSFTETATISSYTATCSAAEPSEQFLAMWTLRNLEANCLCSCLQVLVADTELLESYYKPWSFLRNELYATSLFISLSALELRQCSLLSQIEPELCKVVLRTPVSLQPKRSSSHPNIQISLTKRSSVQKRERPQTVIARSISLQPTAVLPTFRRIKSLPTLIKNSHRSTDPFIKMRPRSRTMVNGSKPISVPKKESNTKLKCSFGVIASSSFSSSYNSDDTQPSTSVSSKVSQSTLESLVSNISNHTNNSTPSTAIHSIQLIKCDDIKIWTDREWEECPNRESSAPKRTVESCSIPHNVEKTKSMSPINSFLSSFFSPPSDPSDAFHSCNSLHSASSGVLDSFMPKYGKKLPARKSQNFFDDDINQKYYECPSNFDVTARTSGTVEATPTTITNNRSSQNLVDFLRMTQLSRNNTELEKENAHFRVSEAIISAIERIKWANIKPEKLRRQNETTTAMDWQESEQNQKDNSIEETQTLKDKQSGSHIACAEVGEICVDTLSAEAVGLSLISKFNDQHLPKVSELKGLLTEENTCQKSTLMRNNSSSSNINYNILPPIIRGTKYWAPPRQQIIFTDHPLPNRKELIQKQNSRCAGCGMWVHPQYVNSFRYCTYLGKYHCTGCHRNQISATPAKILQKWDFKCYPVSVFAYHLLEQMYTWPLFYVPALNAELYNRSRDLSAARSKRVQLRFVKDFIKSCRFATTEQNYFTAIPDYICKDPDIWSMSDFVDANSKNLERCLSELILKSETHIFNCVLCTARGFICEHCRHDEVIFPWQNKVYRCDQCGGLFHQNCWKTINGNCRRCQRIRNRQAKVVNL